MKKFLENRYALSMTLVAIIVASLFIPGILGKVVCLGFVMVVQFMLESFDRSLGWDEYQSFEDGLAKDETDRFKRNICFSGVKILCLGLVIGYGLYFEPSDRLNLIVGLLAIIIPTIWFLSYYGRELMSRHSENEIGSEYFDDSFEKLRRFITMFLLTSSLIIAYLYFGTWHVWLASALTIFILSNGLMIEMIDDELQHELAKRRIIGSVLLAPFVIGIISMIVQFWSYISNFFVAIWAWSVDAVIAAWDFIVLVLTYRLSLWEDYSISVWLVLFLVFVVFLLFKITAYYRNVVEQDKRTVLNMVKLEREKAEAEKLKAEKERIRDENLMKIIYSLAHDFPISKEHLFYLGKNLSFVGNFPIKKITNFNFESLFEISDVRKKIVWEHDLQFVLVMYNSFYIKNDTDDEELAAIITAMQKICIFVEQYREYKSFDAFKKMLDEATPNIPSYWASWVK